MTLNPLRLTPFQRVIASLVAGVLVGLFFGEPMGKLAFLGDVYIRLLQMTVIPYILVSLISGLGRLEMDMARRIARRGGGLILFLWLLTMLSLLFLPLAYPTWTSASFFSTSLVAESPALDLMSLYIPSNPFYSLANTIIPAIVLFSIFLGVAMITVSNKDNFLLSMNNLGDALMKIASVVADSAPIGIFALSATAAGTLEIQELSRLQVYLWVYLSLWLILAIFTLPMLVAWGTPFRYREVIKEAKLAMVTAFATGTVLVVLPMIAERTRHLLSERKLESDDANSTIDVLVPTAYSFPSVGTLMGIGFILFAAWFYGSPLGIDQYPTFTILGLLTAFGTMPVALPFMLNFFKLPSDLFQLYLLGSVFTMRFATAMAALHGIVICILGVCAMMNRLKWRRVLTVAGASLCVTAVAMTALGFLLTKTIPYEYTGYRDLVDMELTGQTVKVNNEADPDPLDDAARTKSRIDVIRQRGSLRVGYFKNRLPFAFRNKHGHVVGFDMELVHVLASDLGVRLDVVQIEWDNAGEELAGGRVDLVIGGISISADRALKLNFSDSYRDETLGLIVPDHLRNQFSDMSRIDAMKGLKIGATPFRFKEGSGQDSFKNAEIVEIESPRQFLNGELPDIDAMIYTAESAAAWTLIYPDWTVVVPKGLDKKAPMAFALPKNQPEWHNFINSWLNYHMKSGLGEQAYKYWILGQVRKKGEHRWSVIQDILGWVD